MKLKLHRDARLEVKEGTAFYRRRSPLTAVAFVQEIEAAFSRIAESPLRYPAGE